MNKLFLRAMLAMLTLALLLTACGQQHDSNSDPDGAAPDAQPGNLYADFFSGSATASALLIGYGTESAEVSFREPDVYVGAGADGTPVEWTITHFALLDMDCDGVRELILAISLGESEDVEYIILTCSGGALCANQLVYRGFLAPKADGSFGWSSGAADNGYARARFEDGVLVCDTFASLLGSGDGSITYTLNGETVSKEAYSVFLSEQEAKAVLTWTVFTLENIRLALDASNADNTDTITVQDAALHRTLTYPAAWERTGVVTAGGDNDPTGAGGEITLFSLCEKRACAHYDGEGGLVWSVYALPRDSFHRWFGDDFCIDTVIGAGKYVLGADENYVYFLSEPTDVQYLEEDAHSRSQYEALQSTTRPVLAAFLAANGIEVNPNCPSGPLYWP